MIRADVLENNSCNKLAEGVEGYYLYNKNDTVIGKSIAKYGESNIFEMNIFKVLCKTGDAVIDVGANIGIHTVGLAKHVGQRGRVYAFEPQRLSFQLLCANVAMNGFENVECHHAALGVKDTILTVAELDQDEENDFSAVSLVDEDLGQQVECLRLDCMSTLPFLKLINIDVSGMEIDVLQGGRELIEKFKPYIYIANNTQENSEALIRLISELGYRMYWHTPPLFNPNNYYGEQENIFPSQIAVNMLCVHEEIEINTDGLEEVTNFFYHPLQKTANDSGFDDR